MHITALVESPDHVCCRYRMAAFRPFFERAGHQLELRPWPRRWWSQLRLTRVVRQADVVVLQRKLMPIWQLYTLRCSAPRLIFDFDDAIFHRDSYSHKGLHCLRRQLAFSALVESADRVVAGNGFLGEQTARWTAADKIQVIPTCLDPDSYPLASHHRTGKGVQLVWVGSSSTLRGLEQIQPQLEVIGRKVPGTSLKLISDRFLKLHHLPVIPCPWTASHEAVDVASADVGISWVPDDLWSRGKCALKVLQYMAAGLPVVANPVGVQADLVRPGETGFHAQTPEEWVEAIARLAADPALRRRMGLAGRERVEQEFSVAAGAARWLQLLSHLTQPKTAGRETA